MTTQPRTKPRVAVAGGGLAGITAALRLAERNYDVTLYEQKAFLGGNVASRPTDWGAELDVYPHMFLSWYHNFWQLLEDAHVNRDEAFEPLMTVKQLKKAASPGDFPTYASLTNAYSPRYMLRNLFSGVGPPADMFVFWYSTIDLLAERCAPTMLLDDVSVTGFLQARPYMTERAAKACDSFITMVWAIPAYLAAAEDYRSYLAYSVTSYKPPCLLAKGPAGEKVIGPLQNALISAGVTLELKKEIVGVSCRGNEVTQIAVESTEFDDGAYVWLTQGDREIHEVDDLVLAIPPVALSGLVRKTVSAGPAYTGPDLPIVKVAPKLAELSRLRSQHIPIVHVTFNRRLNHIPPEPVGLYDSELALAFTDISQVWTDGPEFADHTVLSVSASNPYGLPGTGDDDDGYAILRELHEYVDFNLGDEWGNGTDDIDWAQTTYESNADSQLFINETGIDVWRPSAKCEIENLYFAGNFCANRIGMMTVESAVASGLEAARAIVADEGFGRAVEIIEPTAAFDLFCVWLRYLYGPSALAAKSWSQGTDKLNQMLRCLTPRARWTPSGGTTGAPGPQGPGAA